MPERAYLNYKEIQMKAVEFLEKAEELLKERGKEYDKNEEERSILATVIAFEVVTKKHLTESEGWLFMLLLKQVRQWSKEEYHEDSALDSVSYSALLAESLSEEGE